MLVGRAQDPTGAMTVLVRPEEGGKGAAKVSFEDGLVLLHPQQAIDILCMRERAFGKRGLPAPTGPADQA